MTESFLSLLSIVFGIIGSNLIAFIYKKYSFGLIGNTIIGVFGSVFVIKLFSRLGFGTSFIVNSGDISFFLLIINLIISIFGGGLAIVLSNKIKQWIDKRQNKVK